MSKAARPTETILEVPFKIESIAKTDAPAGSEGVWCRYVISQGTNLINGVRAGNQAEVANLLQDMVERLNERRIGKHRPKTKG
jgi:hypothetical protein